MKRKFKNQRGESFIETIAAMLIICLGMLILAGSIVSAARVNKRAASETIQVTPPLHPASHETDTGWSLNADGWQASNNWFVKIGDSGETLNVTMYKAVPEGGEGNGNALYYYTFAP